MISCNKMSAVFVAQLRRVMCSDVVKAIFEAEAQAGAETTAEIKARLGICVIRLPRSVNFF